MEENPHIIGIKQSNINNSNNKYVLKGEEPKISQSFLSSSNHSQSRLMKKPTNKIDEKFIDNKRTHFAIVYLLSILRKKQDINNSNNDILKKLQRKLMFVFLIFQAIYFLTAFFEYPNWCYVLKNEVNDTNFKGIKANNDTITRINTDTRINNYNHIITDDDEDDSNYLEECSESIATFGIPFLPRNIIRPIQMLILLFFIVYNFINYRIRHKLDKEITLDKLRILIIIVLCSVSFFDLLFSLTTLVFQHYPFPYFNFISRGIVVCLQSRILRTEWLCLIKVIRQSLKIFFIILLFILIFTYIGLLLFKENPTLTDESNSFSSFIRAFNTVIYLLTITNFPDPILPQFEYSVVYSFLFFGPFMIINFLWFQRLIQANFYNNYNQIKISRTKELIETYLNDNYYNDEEDDDGIDNKKKDINAEDNFYNNNVNKDSNNNNYTNSNSNYILESNKGINDPGSTILDCNISIIKNNDGFINAVNKQKNNTSNNFSLSHLNSNLSSNLNSRISPITVSGSNLNSNDSNIIAVRCNKKRNTKSYFNNRNSKNNKSNFVSESHLIECFNKLYSKIRLTEEEKDYIIKSFINPSYSSIEYLNSNLIIEDMKMNNNEEILLKDDQKAKSLKKIATFLSNDSTQSLLNESINNKTNTTSKFKNITSFYDNQITEIVSFLINFISISLFFFNVTITYSKIIFLINLIPNLYYILEYTLILTYYPNKKEKFLYNNKSLSIFFFLNLSSTISIIVYCIFPSDDLFLISQILTVCRFLRIMVLLNQVEEFNLMFVTLDNMRDVLLSLFTTLIGFLYIFSSITMLFLAGKVKVGEYDDDDTISNMFYHLHYNGFSGSMITSFCLTVNTNWGVVTALSNVVGEWLLLYFTIFYFISVNLIVKLINTFILDLCINYQVSFSKKKEEEERKLEESLKRYASKMEFAYKGNYHETNEATNIKRYNSIIIKHDLENDSDGKDYGIFNNLDDKVNKSFDVIGDNKIGFNNEYNVDIKFDNDTKYNDDIKNKENESHSINSSSNYNGNDNN